jgi:hypothetical protein
MLRETKHSSAILCVLLAFMGLILQVPTMMLKSTPMHCFAFQMFCPFVLQTFAAAHGK